MDSETLKTINKVCSFVCNGRTYKYEQKLKKAIESELYDAAVIYLWKIMMLFIYEKIWQIRAIENEEGIPFETDQIFLPNKKLKRDRLSGNLFSLTDLEEKENVIVGKLNRVYIGVDPQIFKQAQHILKIRHTAAHPCSIDLELKDFFYMLQKSLEILKAIQLDHRLILERIIGYEDDFNIVWHFSKQDKKEIKSLN